MRLRPAIALDRPEGDATVPALVLSAQAGDSLAFGALYQRFAGYVHAILLARLPPQEAPDLVQDVFLQAFERLETLRDAAAFPGWLAVLARNRATDFFRARRAMDPLEDRAAVEASPDVRLETTQVLARIRDLPDAYRETLILRLVQGMSGPEIAAVTGLKPESVRVNLHRGFRLLRERLGVGHDD